MTDDSNDGDVDLERSSNDINKAISDLLKRSNRVKISGLKGQDNVAVGLTGNVEIDIKGRSGRYLGAFNDGPVIVMQGTCGDLAADNLIKGGLIVMGDAGEMCGLSMIGGILVIKGNAGTDLANKNVNGTVIVDGNVKGDVGTGMIGGTIMITGDIHGDIGKCSTGGMIFHAGQLKGSSGSLKITEPTEKDISRLKRFFDHYGIDAIPKSFRKIHVSKEVK